MADRDRTYTMDELVEESGFDRRTVAYYVQEELLPKVGRRGPRTRYPRLFLDRLLFVRRVRDLQDRGELSPLTLAEIKETLDRLSPDTIARVARGEEDVTAVLGESEVGIQDSLLMRRPRGDVAASVTQMMVPEMSSELVNLVDLPETVTELLQQAKLSREEGEERWTTVSISRDVLLTVRGDRPTLVRLAEALAHRIRGLKRR
jgi:DNA-binding transcriptional MerR regulator